MADFDDDDSGGAVSKSFPPELARDEVLNLFVHIVSAITAPDSPGIPITVVVGGAVISGRLIGEQSYFGRLAVTLGVAEISPDTHLPELLDSWTELAKDQLANERPFEPRFLHLENAIPVAAAAPIVAEEGLLMRIRLSDVQGFALAELRPSTRLR